MARVDDLTLSADQAAARLAELDALPIDQKIRGTYTAPDGHTYDYNGYRSMLLQTIKDSQSAPKGESSQIQIAGGIFTIYG